MLGQPRTTQRQPCENSALESQVLIAADSAGTAKIARPEQRRLQWRVADATHGSSFARCRPVARRAKKES